MSKHLFKLIGVKDNAYAEISKWATVEEALTARSLAIKEQEACMQTGEQVDYINFIIIVEY